MDGAAFDDAGGDAAMASHGVVAAGAQVFFHSGTGVAVAGHFQHDFPDPELPVSKSQEVDTSHNDVSAGEARLDACSAEHFADSLKVLKLNEGNFPVSAFAIVMITNQPDSGFCGYL